MTVINPILTQRALMLAKIESTFNVDAAPTPSSDALLVMNADFRINPNVLRRNFYRPSLSQLPIAIGRKLAQCQFTHELKGSGVNGTAPKIGTLLRGCGFSQTQIASGASSQIATAAAYPFNAGPTVTWGKTAAPTKGFGRWKAKVVLGGASATAKIQVFGAPADYDDAVALPADDYSALVMGPGATTTVTVDTTNPLSVTYTVATPQIGDVIVVSVGGLRYKYTVASAVANTEASALAAIMVDTNTRFTAAAVGAVITATITGGVTTVTTASTAVALGQSSATVTPSWTGNLVLNDYWNIDTYDAGYHYVPISNNFESLTIYMYYDGSLHRLTGCMGTVVFTMAAGNYASAQFTFTGQYINPDDQPLPLTPTFERSIPQQVELAELMIGNLKRLRAQQFTVDMGITINPRESVSHPDGYDGVLYTGRDPKGGANPEMNLESVEPYWRHLAAADVLKFFGRCGTNKNNIVTFSSNSIQLTGNQYQDRNNNRVYDLGYEFKRDTDAGDDEIRITFPQAA